MKRGGLKNVTSMETRSIKSALFGFFPHNGHTSINLSPDIHDKEISKCRGTDCYLGSTRESLVKGNIQ